VRLLPVDPRDFPFEKVPHHERVDRLLVDVLRARSLERSTLAAVGGPFGAPAVEGGAVFAVNLSRGPPGGGALASSCAGVVTRAHRALGGGEEPPTFSGRGFACGFRVQAGALGLTCGFLHLPPPVGLRLPVAGGVSVASGHASGVSGETSGETCGASCASWCRERAPWRREDET
jgi:hypothetical protein